MALDENWFSEPFEETGSAFSLKITEKLHEEQSPFQHIEIYQTEAWGRLMVFDGCVMLTSLDNFIYHEMMSHPALFTHPSPRRVLIIGGGDCGTLREVLKHESVTKAVQVDIDERVTRVTEMFFPELCDSNNDPRAELLFEDGIKYVADAEAGSFDVVIIDSTDPVGQAARLFSEDFYRDCHSILGRDGILVVQSESPLKQRDLIRQIHSNMGGAGFSSTRTLHFPQPCYPTGWWSCTMAAKSGILPGFRYDDAAAKQFETKYYTADGHRGAASLPLLNP